MISSRSTGVFALLAGLALAASAPAQQAPTAPAPAAPAADTQVVMLEPVHAVVQGVRDRTRPWGNATT
jgi:hypothetical protein